MFRALIHILYWRKIEEDEENIFLKIRTIPLEITSDSQQIKNITVIKKKERKKTHWNHTRDLKGNWAQGGESCHDGETVIFKLTAL